MNEERASTPPAGSAIAPGAERVRISCPGCGRGDFVTWPHDREIYHWKCFNCRKEFDLTRDGSH